MELLKEYLVPYLISNILAAACIVCAIARPMWARIFLAAFFLWASYINSHIAIQSPETYLDYARLTPVPFYQHFIRGFFAHHIRPLILGIACGQFLIFLGLVLNGIWTRLACLGGILFGLAIAPLGVGSAFPATLSMAIAFYILLIRHSHDFIWKWKQYQPGKGLAG